MPYLPAREELYLYAALLKRLNKAMALQPDTKPTAGQTPDVAAAPSHEDLLVAVGKSGNRDAFIQLFEYYAPRLKSFLMKGGFAADTADELAQDVMLTVWDKAGKYDPQKASASTWIYTIARNKRIDLFRKNGRTKPDPHDPLLTPDGTPAADELVLSRQQQETLRHALKELPEEQASMLRKAYFEDKTHKEIAEESGLPLGTVKSRIRLALDRMRHSLRGMES